MKIILTICYSLFPGDVQVEAPRIEMVGMYIEHMPLELKKSKRERWWPRKPYNALG